MNCKTKIIITLLLGTATSILTAMPAIAMTQEDVDYTTLFLCLLVTSFSAGITLAMVCRLIFRSENIKNNKWITFLLKIEFSFIILHVIIRFTDIYILDVPSLYILYDIPVKEALKASREYDDPFFAGCLTALFVTIIYGTLTANKNKNTKPDPTPMFNEIFQSFKKEAYARGLDSETLTAPIGYYSLAAAAQVQETILKYPEFESYASEWGKYFNTRWLREVDPCNCNLCSLECKFRNSPDRFPLDHPSPILRGKGKCENLKSYYEAIRSS